MRPSPFWIPCAVLLAASVASEPLALAESTAAGVEPVREEAVPAPAVSEKIKDAKLRKHILENIEVFGKSDMPAIYILAPGLEDYEGFLLVRDFSRDPFFMQNIDREEFEMKTYLREFHEEGDEDQEKKEER